MANNKKSKTPITNKENKNRQSNDRKSSRNRPPQKSGMNPQVKAILLCATSVLLFALLIVKGGRFWLVMKNFMFGMFGFCFVLVPFVFLYMGIMTAKEKQMAHKKAKIILSILIVMFSCTLIYLCGSIDYNDRRSYVQALGDAFSGSYERNSMCGMMGAIFGYAFRDWFTTVPAVIVSLVCLGVFIMLLTGVTLVDIANVAHKQYDRYAQRKEERKKKKAQYVNVVDDFGSPDDFSFVGAPQDRIDIPLDNDGKKSKKPLSPESEADQKIIDIIKNANSGIIAQEEPQDPTIIAEKISKRKTSNVMSDGAKQADPQTVPVDLEKETEDIEKQVSKTKETQTKTEKKKLYNYPPVKLLDPSMDTEGSSAMLEMQNNATKLVDTLKSFGVSATITNICRGPSVTRYELQPAAGVKISKITNLSDDIALNLAAKGVRIEAPIPGKAAIGIEVPNKVTSMVSLRELIDSDEFKSSKSKLSCVLGRDISGEVVVTDLSKMPHLLIAGTTGSGKSVCVNSLLMSILFKATPDEVKILLIDPKMVEFSKYKGIPHLLVPVVSDAKKAAGALNWAVSEMLNRYKLFSEYDCKDINSYNVLIQKNLDYIAENSTDDGEEVCMEVGGLPVAKEKLPQIVIAIDELADLMMAAPSEVEDAICRLAQMARAAGMHLIIATQRPSVNVITGVIKANIPSRIALKVSSNIDSRTILDASGAEKLIGRGDMLFSPVGASQPTRVQGCFARDEEIERVTGYIKKSHDAQYNAEVEERIRKIAAEELGKDAKGGAATASSDNPDVDSLMEEAIKVVVEAGQASTSLLQRRLKVGYARAGRMIDDMEQMGIVGPHQGSKARDVLLTYNEWLERNHVLDIHTNDDEISDEEY